MLLQKDLFRKGFVLSSSEENFPMQTSLISLFWKKDSKDVKTLLRNLKFEFEIFGWREGVKSLLVMHLVFFVFVAKDEDDDEFDLDDRIKRIISCISSKNLILSLMFMNML